jgi:hypothetical protein
MLAFNLTSSLRNCEDKCFLFILPSLCIQLSRLEWAKMASTYQLPQPHSIHFLFLYSYDNNFEGTGGLLTVSEIFWMLNKFPLLKTSIYKKKNRAKSLFRNLILLHLVSVLVFPISNIYTLVTYIGQAVSRTNKWNCANHTVLFKLWLPLSLFLPLIGNEIMLQHDLIGIGSIFINQEVSGKGT